MDKISPEEKIQWTSNVDPDADSFCFVSYNQRHSDLR